MEATIANQMPTAQETQDYLLNISDAESLKQGLKEMYNGYLKSNDSNDPRSRERLLKYYDALDGFLETLIMIQCFENENKSNS